MASPQVGSTGGPDRRSRYPFGAGRPATVKAAAAHGAVAFFERAGADPDEVLRAANLRRSDLQDPTHDILLSDYCRMFEIAARAALRPNLGLEFGRSFSPQQLGFVGYLASSAPTLGHALQAFTAAMPFHQQGTVMDLSTIGQDRAAVSYGIVDGTVAGRRQDAELSIAVVLNLMRLALGRHWAPHEIHFAHPKPQSCRAHDLAFGAPIYFLRDDNRIVFDLAVLESRMPNRDDVLHALIAAQMTPGAHACRSSDDVVSRARYFVERLLALGQCELDAVADACGMPSWTFKRRLRARGLTFQELVARTRCDLAIQYLTEHRLSATEVALALGYSELSAFSRAFRQWTGVAPSDYLDVDLARSRDVNS